VLPGMLDSTNRQRGDLIFVGSDVALRQRPHMGRLRRGPRRRRSSAMVSTSFPMEPTGTGVSWPRSRASRPTKTSMGWSLPVRQVGPARWRTGQVGPGPAGAYFLSCFPVVAWLDLFSVSIVVRTQ